MPKSRHDPPAPALFRLLGIFFVPFARAGGGFGLVAGRVAASGRDRPEAFLGLGAQRRVEAGGVVGCVAAAQRG